MILSLMKKKLKYLMINWQVHALIEMAKEQARRERRRAIILVLGCIMYSKSFIVDGKNKHEIITFGPLCVEPEWQGCCVGELLLRETMKEVANKGYKGKTLMLLWELN